MDDQANVLKQFQADLNIMEILTIIHSLNLKDSWLAAGSVRNYIWNRLSGKSGFDAETDVDVIFYDPAVSYEETVALEQKLRDAYPQYRWELKNQVYMHSHIPATSPYLGSCDAMSKYQSVARLSGCACWMMSSWSFLRPMDWKIF